MAQRVRIKAQEYQHPRWVAPHESACYASSPSGLPAKVEVGGEASEGRAHAGCTMRGGQAERLAPARIHANPALTDSKSTYRDRERQRQNSQTDT